MKIGNSPVSWRDLLLLLLLVIGVSSAAGGAMTWWLLAHFTARVPLANQLLTLRLPQDLPVQVEITGATVNSAASTQTMPVRVKQRLRLQVSIDSMVPLDTVVPYRGEIPIHTMLHLDTKVRTRLLGIPVTLPVVADVPLDVKLPVDLTIPVKQSVRLKFTAPVTADIDQVLDVPIPGVLDSHISFPGGPLQMRILEGELKLPLDRVSLEGLAPWGADLQFGPAQAPPLTPPARGPGAGGEN